jgi:hypothetical protein
MKVLKVLAAPALGALFLSGCGMATGVADKTSAQTQMGSSVISFAIPVHPQGSQFTGFQKTNQHTGISANVATPKPQFMDSIAFTAPGSALQLYLDTHNVATISFTGIATDSDGNLQPGPGPSATSTSTPDGGSISYHSTITSTEIDVTVNLTTISEMQHTLGIVQTNGACVGTDPCIANNSGYVLAEGQTSFTLNTGSSNSGVSLTLQPVLEAGFICPTGSYPLGCNGTPGALGTDGWYHITAMPTNENGVTAIPQTKPADWAPYLTAYGNGAWQIEELDENHVVDLEPDTDLGTDSLGPYITPKPIQRPSGYYWDGQYAKFKCQKNGTAIIGMRLYPGAPGSKAVKADGFTHNSNNYPDAGALLGSTGSDIFYGNGAGMTVQCNMYGSVAISVN